MTKDQIVCDLKVIRKHGWGKSEGLEKLALLAQPHIVDASREPKEAPQLVETLRREFGVALKSLRRREKGKKKRSPYPLANACGAVLHLDADYEDMPIEKVRKKIAAEWLKNDGKECVKVGHFRQNIEVPLVLEAFADELIRLGLMREERKKKQPRGSRSKDQEASMEVLISEELQAMETATYDRRCESLKNGSLEIRDEDEMFKVLLMATKLARQDFKAVDSTQVTEWLVDPLKNFLDEQLARVKKDKIELVRIYLVGEEQLEKPEFAKDLAELIRLHEDGSATLLLCPLKVATELKVPFEEHRGLFLIDSEGEPLAVTGMLGVDDVGDAFIHTRDNDQLRKLRTQYKLLLKKIRDEAYDVALRTQLGLI